MCIYIMYDFNSVCMYARLHACLPCLLACLHVYVCMYACMHACTYVCCFVDKCKPLKLCWIHKPWVSELSCRSMRSCSEIAVAGPTGIDTNNKPSGKFAVHRWLDRRSSGSHPRRAGTRTLTLSFSLYWALWPVAKFRAVERGLGNTGWRFREG